MGRGEPGSFLAAKDTLLGARPSGRCSSAKADGAFASRGHVPGMSRGANTGGLQHRTLILLPRPLSLSGLSSGAIIVAPHPGCPRARQAALSSRPFTLVLLEP